MVPFMYLHGNQQLKRPCQLLAAKSVLKFNYWGAC